MINACLLTCTNFLPQIPIYEFLLKKCLSAQQTKEELSLAQISEGFNKEIYLLYFSKLEKTGSITQDNLFDLLKEINQMLDII